MGGNGGNGNEAAKEGGGMVEDSLSLHFPRSGTKAAKNERSPECVGKLLSVRCAPQFVEDLARMTEA